MPFHNRLPEFKAEVYFLTSEEGGRTSFCISGYRPVAKFDGKHFESCALQFKDDVEVNPRETVITECCMIYIAEWHIEHIKKGKEFKLQESNIIIAKGKVLEVYEERMKVSI